MIIFEATYSREVLENAGGASNIVSTHPRVVWAADNGAQCELHWQKDHLANNIMVKVDAKLTPIQRTEFLLRFS